jgi:hypothetical protein
LRKEIHVKHVALRLVLVVLSAISLTACTNNVRSSYTQATIASYAKPDTRTMQIGNGTACTHWPAGANLAIYCDEKLVAELKPKQDIALTLPLAQFKLKVVALDTDGKTIGILSRTFKEPPNILPSWSVRREAFIDPSTAPGSADT